MKKILFSASVLAACYGVKAQSKPGIALDTTWKNMLHSNMIVIKPGMQQLLPDLQRPNLQSLVVLNDPLKISPVDHMPLFAQPGGSKMPVAKLGGMDQMPVLKLSTDKQDAASAKPVTP